METYSVIGAGTMGQSIALAIAMSGKQVKIWCYSEQEKEKSWHELTEKIERLHAFDMACNQETIFLSTDLEEVIKDTTFVIEAVPENLYLKQEWYKKLDQLCPEHVILASNTSGFCASEMVIQMRFPERMLVTHFWNPAHLILLVEVVPGENTASETTNRAMEAMNEIGKKPISKREHSSVEMQQLVENGQYGMKTGQGFYVWGEVFTKEIN